MMKKQKYQSLGIVIFLLAFSFVQSNAQTILMQESFTGNVLPAGWAQDSAGLMPQVDKWIFNNLPQNFISGVGFDSNYVRVSDSFQGEYSLVTNSINTTGHNIIFLSYSEFYLGGNSFNGQKFMLTEVSSDGGTTWNLVMDNYSYGHQSGSQTLSTRKVINISNYAANQTNVKIRFHHMNGFYWALDSIVVSDSAWCTQPSDSNGVVTNDKVYLCNGSLTNLKIESLSRGFGQTYQWQVSNAANGNLYTDISGATADTLVYPQNGESFYRCMITCQSAASATSKPLKVLDKPNTPGSIVSYANMGICSSVNDTLAVRNFNIDTALSHQWIYSDSLYGTYVDIPGATDTTYVVSASNYSNNTFFRCKSVCSSSLNFSTSNAWVGFLNQNPYCYCLGFNNNWCSPPLPFVFGGGITKVSIASTSLNNLSVPCNNPPVQDGYNYNYSFFQPTGNATTTLIKGQQYSFKVVIDTSWNSYGLISFWIDYNRNGSFDAYEFTQVSAVLINPGDSATVTFTVPFNAVSGLTGLRVRSCSNTTPLYPGSACAYVSVGETEDYMITIDTATAITDLATQQQGMQIHVYPNPASGKQQINITVNSNIAKNKTVEIINMQGSSILIENFVSNVFTTQATFSPGIYAVKVKANGEQSIVKRLVVVK
jgi:GEVED domain/Secretion system C-terminal sorting domain